MNQPLLRTLVLAALGALPILAQTTPAPLAYSAALTMDRGFDSLTDITGKRTGFSFELALDLPDPSAPYRIGIGHTAFGSSTRSEPCILTTNGVPGLAFQDGPGLSLATTQFYLSLRTSPLRGVKLYFGISANREDLAGEKVKGTKLGGRIDLEAALTDHLAGVVTFQAITVGLDGLGSAAYNPSWLQAGLRYRF
jgi:hypothetical protein